MVPMHLGLIDRPFVPHNLIRAQESSVPLPRFQMAPRLKILMSSGSKKGTQMYYPFLSKVPASQSPPGSPAGPCGERCTYLEPFLTYLLGSPVKEPSQRPSTLSLFREKHSIPRVSFIHLSKSPVDEPPSMFPIGVLMERDAHLQSLFYLSRVPSKGALPPGSLHRALIERDTPPAEPLSAISESPQ